MSQENRSEKTFPWDYQIGDENFQKEPWILSKGKENVAIEKNLDNKGPHHLGSLLFAGVFFFAY